MKQYTKHFGIITLMATIVCSSTILLLTSCGPQGGTIVVTNNFSGAKEVKIYSGKISGALILDGKEWGKAIIPAGETKSFNVDENKNYHVQYYSDYYGTGFIQQSDSKYKTIHVSKGDTVNISIP
jgi:hypothetical protein